MSGVLTCVFRSRGSTCRHLIINVAASVREKVLPGVSGSEINEAAVRLPSGWSGVSVAVSGALKRRIRAHRLTVEYGRRGVEHFDEFRVHAESDLDSSEAN